MIRFFSFFFNLKKHPRYKHKSLNDNDQNIFFLFYKQFSKAILLK